MKYLYLRKGLIETRNVQTGETVYLNVTTEELIRESLDTRPPAGFSYTDMKARLRIDDAIKSQKLQTNFADYLRLEDQDFETLKNCVKDMRWNLRGQFIIDFCESVLNYKDIAPVETPQVAVN